jgi:hypothetical protein
MDDTRILEYDSLTWGSLVGERWAMARRVLPTRIMMRDYNLFRVCCAVEILASCGKEVKHGCRSVVKVVKKMLSYCIGELFCDDIETGLPNEEIISITFKITPYFGCEGIFMDEDNLLANLKVRM